MRTAGKPGGSAPDAHDVRRPERHVAAVEIAHLAAAHADGADGEARVPAVEVVEIDEVAQRALERLGGVERRALDADREMEAPGRMGIGLEEAGHALRNGVQIGERAGEECRRPGIVEAAAVADPAPEFL